MDEEDSRAAEGDAAADYIRKLYDELLHRAPAEQEHVEWIGALTGGMSRESIRDAFIASPEYLERQRTADLQSAIAASGLFDAAWYLATYPDVATAGWEPLQHYSRHGRAEARAPNAYFDDVSYRQRSGIDADTPALLHYVQHGEAAGIAPGTDFDPVWYRAAHGLGADTSPLAHYLAHRHSRRVAPCPNLWSVTGLPSVPGDRGEGDPFLPWLAADTPLKTAAADLALLRPSGLFDENHYQLTQNDVFESGMDGLLHYCAFGWREGRNPNFYFNAAWYVATNPDVTRLGVNPLVHYLLAGEPAGRRPVIYFEPDWYRRRYELPVGVSPLAHYLAHRRSQMFSPNSLFDPDWYLAQCRDRVQRRRDPFAHYLVAGMHQDLQPSPRFDAVAWRRRTRGRPSRHFRTGQYPERDNPLVNYLLTTYQ